MELTMEERPPLDRAAARWQADEANAANEVWALCGARLLRLARSLTGSDSQAEDAVQEAFLRAWRFLGRYQPDRAFEPWITTILVRECRRIARRTPTHAALPAGLAQPEPSLRLFHAIEELPRPLRETVALHYLHGYDVRETAATLGIPAGTVKSRLSRARGLLRQAMKEEEE